MISLSMTFGAGVTVTVVEAVRVPPAPVPVIAYCVVDVGQTSREPVGFTLPIPGSIEPTARIGEAAMKGPGDTNHNSTSRQLRRATEAGCPRPSATRAPQPA